ncbi:MAG: sucrase ferredoxin [Anaerolineales bacterium]
MSSTDTRAYCNVLAQQQGLDPAGYADDFDAAFLLELPLPWPFAILLEPEKLPPELVELIQIFIAMPQAERPRIRPLFIAPDDAYSRPGYRRFIYYTRPEGAFAAFTRTEYLLPEAEVGPLIWALQQAPETVAAFDAYRVDAPDTRDILVCTHGARDAACAKFGYPLYRTLRDELAAEHLRVWRVNHFGGHVFAPTLMDMPKGDYWAFVNPAEGRMIVNRSGDITALHGHYRGCAGLAHGFTQALEREILMREGWAWQTYAKLGTEIAKDEAEKPSWAEVRIDYAAPDGRARGAYTGRVTIQQHITTIASTGETKEHAYPQYAVTNLEKNEG